MKALVNHWSTCQPRQCHRKQVDNDKSICPYSFHLLPYRFCFIIYICACLCYETTGVDKFLFGLDLSDGHVLKCHMSYVGFLHKSVSQTRPRCTSITTGMIMEQYNVQIFLFAMTVLKVRKNYKRRNSYLPGLLTWQSEFECDADVCPFRG